MVELMTEEDLREIFSQKRPWDIQVSSTNGKPWMDSDIVMVRVERIDGSLFKKLARKDDAAKIIKKFSVGARGGGQYL